MDLTKLTTEVVSFTIILQNVRLVELEKEEITAVIAYLHTLWTPEQLETQQDITRRYREP